ncbi:MAG TPA: DUF86 domain-containing protein [Chthoniobacteraceae bacterium]|jgi:uncharacterized protein with HEPN domain|nr:DUF86 domain-containing protein [Chthoniobacteraceae bacterium]
MPDETQLGLLRDILDSATTIRGYLSGVTRDTFMVNTEKQDAVLRRFEIIGEAASRLTPETQALFPQLPFRAMRGMRNIIAHDYGDVDLDQVWQTAGADLKPLIEALETYFGE